MHKITHVGNALEQTTESDPLSYVDYLETSKLGEWEFFISMPFKLFKLMPK